MAPARCLIFFLGAALVPLLLFSCADASAVGVNYGTVADDLLDPESAVQLLLDTGITMVRIYDTNATILNALANKGIKVMVMMPNGDIADAARSRSYAFDWVRRNVAAYLPDTEINGLAVGNEVFQQAKDLTSKLLPAMVNVQAALAKLGLDDAVKVTTPVAFDAVGEPSFPPSRARFRDDIAQSVMKPMLQFLQRTGSYLTINPYPFLAVAKEPQNIPLEFALGSYEPGVEDPNTGLVYYSLLDAMRDATFFAVENLTEPQMQTMASGSKNAGQIIYTVMTETGWSSGGQVKLPQDAEMTSSKAGVNECPPATVANAKAYNNYVINRVLSGDTGTPRYPDMDMDVYIFALFNENKKGVGADDSERYYGLFYPDGTKVYDFDFQGTNAK
ncbi:unnamed protein product [Urochloa decumbens]|uniref:Glucan endo-1,3-beta-D-glucosidase n=1 Tax=Urochloa decumbens TaxID=240449 RepID=A0ABC9F3G2_9POAL